ncbi:hypothetical protein [Trinickia soli]|uniref:hypothetical protein n=1 Tax=Trinickia soli TaxID=380675 RepID=UPI003FA36FE0
MRTLLVALSILVAQPISVNAQIDVNIGLPGINIGINMSAYPRLVRVPGYPVYYAPQANWNYFFYDGLYWVYQQDNWYVSSWYNGPWQWVGPENVPLYVLRIPVRYYRRPPSYFVGWNRNEPPRWGDHWGRDWESHRRGWDQWDRRSAPPPALLPNYQRQYSGARYPRAAGQQNAIRSEHYHYEPREPITRQYFRPGGNAGDGHARPQPRELRGQPQVDMGQPGQQRRELNQQSPRYEQQQNQQRQNQQQQDRQRQNQQQQNQQQQDRQRQNQQQNQQRPQPSAPPPQVRPPQAPGQESVRPQQRPAPQQAMPAPAPQRQPAPADAMPPRGKPNPPRQQPSGPQQDRQVTRQMPPAQPAQQTPGPQRGAPGNEGDNKGDRRGQSNH